MAITTFPAILSQIGDGSIFVKISKGVYHLQIFTKIDPLQIWLKIAGKVVYAISSNSSNKIGHFWAHFGPFFGVGKIFSHFLATRWGRGGLETSKMDSARVKTYNLTFLPGLKSKNWASYGPKIDFFRYFWSKIHVDLTLEPNISGSGVELGACDTPLESYFWCLQEYVDNSWKRPIKFGW